MAATAAEADTAVDWALAATEAAPVEGSVAAAPVEGSAVRRAAAVRAGDSAVALGATADWAATAEAVADWATPVEEARPSAAYTGRRFLSREICHTKGGNYCTSALCC